MEDTVMDSIVQDLKQMIQNKQEGETIGDIIDRIQSSNYGNDPLLASKGLKIKKRGRDGWLAEDYKRRLDQVVLEKYYCKQKMKRYK